MSQHVTIVGLGLIGGSIGKALRARDWRVSYVDPAVDFDRAHTVGAADERVDAVAASDLVIVATPLDVALKLLDGLDAAVITTTCSVMSPFSGRDRVVAGHPLAGSQLSGVDAARIDLFVGRRWFVERDEPIVRDMIESTGAVCHVVDPAVHDRAVAVTSHLPQILSTALAAHIGRAGADDLLPFAGTGLQTFLRLAGSEGDIWKPVIEANQQPIAEAARAVEEIVARIIEGEVEPFEAAREVFAALNALHGD